MPADKRLPITEETKQLVDEKKDDGVTYDYWIRREALGIEE
jgi:hypothetical protein